MKISSYRCLRTYIPWRLLAIHIFVKGKKKKFCHSLWISLIEECLVMVYDGLLWWLRNWTICLQCRRPWFPPWVGKIPWRRKWQPTPVFLPGEFHGQRSLAGSKWVGWQRVGHDWVTNACDCRPTAKYKINKNYHMWVFISVNHCMRIFLLHKTKIKFRNELDSWVLNLIQDVTLFSSRS